MAPTARRDRRATAIREAMHAAVALGAWDLAGVTHRQTALAACLPWDCETAHALRRSAEQTHIAVDALVLAAERLAVMSCDDLRGATPPKWWQRRRRPNGTYAGDGWYADPGPWPDELDDEPADDGAGPAADNRPLFLIEDL